MAYYLTDTPTAGRGRRRLLATIAALLIVLVGLALLVRPTLRAGPVAAAPAAAEPALSWALVGEQPVPTSPRAGPARTEDGVAAGFSHDELGAVLAAVHIAARLNVDAGPTVYETVARRQCVGDVDAALAQVRSTRSQTAPAATVATGYFYRVDGGDPTTDRVLVTIAADTPQARAAGGYAAFTRTLRWIDGDWRMQVPTAPARLIASVAGYHPLGVPRV
jgi:hypothetical protein